VSRFFNILHAGDNFVNAIFGGDPDASISARTGHYISWHESVFWNTLARIIDWAFDPIEDRHCMNAWNNDPNENYQNARWGDRIGLVLVVVPFCALLGVVLRLYRLIF